MASKRTRQAAVLCAVALANVRCATLSGPKPGPSYVASSQILASHTVMEVMDATGYLAYQSPLPSDLPGYAFSHRVRGEVCQNDLHLPLALEGTHANAALSGAQTLDILWGNASVAQGVADAMQGAPQGAVMYDLALDLHRTSVFGFFFRRQCLVVAGSLALPQGPGPNHEVHDSEPAPQPVTTEPQGAPIQPLDGPALALPPVPTRSVRTPSLPEHRAAHAKRQHKGHKAKTMRHAPHRGHHAAPHGPQRSKHTSATR